MGVALKFGGCMAATVLENEAIMAFYGTWWRLRRSIQCAARQQLKEKSLLLGPLVDFYLDKSSKKDVTLTNLLAYVFARQNWLYFMT